MILQYAGSAGRGAQHVFLLLKVTKITRKVSNGRKIIKKLLKKVQRIKMFAIFARYYYQFLTIKKSCNHELLGRYTCEIHR